MSESERRLNPDRRRYARGGRRPRDRDGFSPLILIVDDDGNSAARSEAILAALKFAVAPARSIEEAMSVMRALRPNLVVARVADPVRLEGEMRASETTAHVPLLLITDDLESPERLIEEIRKVLRARFAVA